MVDVLFGQRLHELGLEPGELTELGEIAQLLSHDRAVLALLKDEDVHDPDDPGVVKPEELVRPLAGEVLGPGRELDDQVIDGPQLVERSVGHDSSIPSARQEPFAS